jgi:hypothetical protein
MNDWYCTTCCHELWGKSFEEKTIAHILLGDCKRCGKSTEGKDLHCVYGSKPNQITVKCLLVSKDGSWYISGCSIWSEQVQCHKDDIVVCGEKQWKVVAETRIIQGCFGAPAHRMHEFKLEPIGHDTQPNEGDVLTVIKETTDNG